MNFTEGTSGQACPPVRNKIGDVRFPVKLGEGRELTLGRRAPYHAPRSIGWRKRASLPVTALAKDP
jgi:hypothetical protein